MIALAVLAGVYWIGVLIGAVTTLVRGLPRLAYAQVHQGDTATVTTAVRLLGRTMASMLWPFFVLRKLTNRT